MGLLRSLISLPVSGPMNATVWVAKKIHETADQELNSPKAIRQALSALEGQLLAGEISEETYDEAETELLLRLKAAT